MVLQPQGNHRLNAPLIDAHRPLGRLGVGVGNLLPGIVVVGNGHRVVPISLGRAFLWGLGALGGGGLGGGAGGQQGEGQGCAQDQLSHIVHRFLLEIGAEKTPLSRGTQRRFGNANKH